MNPRPFRRLTEQDLAEAQALMERLRGLHPPFFVAVREDARMCSARRGRPVELRGTLDTWRTVLRLLWSADHYPGLLLYRFGTALRRRRVPVLPRLIHIVNVYVFRITIGPHVVVREGTYLPHGDVVIDGLVYIGKRCVIAPFTSIGLVGGEPRGPWIEDNVQVGTGARILGPVHIGQGARIGANAVVVRDVAAHDTVVGVPARSVAPGETVDVMDGDPSPL